MSIVNVKRLAGTRRAVDYELYGALGSEKYRKNKAEGTDRVAAISGDLGSPQEFVERAEMLREQNGRKVESRSLIQSFEKDELDPNDPDDVQRVNDLGYMFAKELHPDSDCLVITHTDGAGGHPHNHIKVLNHDNGTGRALRGGDLHWQVAKVNDALMEREGQQVATRGGRGGERSLDQRAFWESRREGGLPEFDEWLGDQTMEALTDKGSVDTASYMALLDKQGIELEETKHHIKASADGSTPAHVSLGWTYKARDEFCEKPRMRRRKASSLSDEHTHEGAHEIFGMNRELAAREQERTDRESAREQSRVAGVQALAPEPIDQSMNNENTTGKVTDDERDGQGADSRAGAGVDVGPDREPAVGTAGGVREGGLDPGRDEVDTDESGSLTEALHQSQQGVAEQPRGDDARAEQTEQAPDRGVLGDEGHAGVAGPEPGREAPGRAHSDSKRPRRPRFVTRDQSEDHGPEL